MDFVIGLLLSADWKNNIYDLILVIIDRLTKIVYYEPVKVTIDISRLTKVIINMVVQYHDLSNSIINDYRVIFTSKFWPSLCFFLGIKRRLSIVFYSQIDGQTNQQNSTMDVYLCVFVNWKQDDWTQLLPILQFAYNNSKNASMGHISFELNCGYYPCVFFKDKCNTCFRSFLAKGLAVEFEKLMNVCHQNLLHAQNF